MSRVPFLSRRRSDAAPVFFLSCEGALPGRFPGHARGSRGRRRGAGLRSSWLFSQCGTFGSGGSWFIRLAAPALNGGGGGWVSGREVGDVRGTAQHGAEASYRGRGVFFGSEVVVRGRNVGWGGFLPSRSSGIGRCCCSIAGFSSALFAPPDAKGGNGRLLLAAKCRSLVREMPPATLTLTSSYKLAYIPPMTLPCPPRQP